LCVEARLQEAVETVGPRREQHETHTGQRKRQSGDGAGEQVVDDQEHEAGLQRDGERN
jgi:hypothetical protein